MSDLHIVTSAADQAAGAHRPKMANPVDVHVGHRLRRARREAGLSQTELADVAGVSFQQLQKYENATNRLSASRLVQFAVATGRAPAWFFDGAPGVPTSAEPAEAADAVAEFLASSAGHALVQRAMTLDGDRLGGLLGVARALSPEH